MDAREEVGGSLDWRDRSTTAMINACFRHQHPEAYGQPTVPEPPIPTHLRYGSDPPVTTSGLSIREEPMGLPDAQPLPH